MKSLAGAAAGVSLVRPAWAAWRQEAPVPIVAAPITDNIVMYSDAGSNVVALGGSDGVLLVNGGRAEQSAALLDLIAARFKGPVKVLFNTDWHLDNTGSNAAAAKASAKIISHENTKLWMGTEIVVQWEHKTYPPRPKDERPNQTFYTTGTMKFGSEDIRYGHLGQAHTDGDIYVLFQTSNVLMTGSACSFGRYPILDYATGGWIGGLSEANKTLVGLTNPQTRIVPGTGPVQTQSGLRAHAEMTATMRQRLVEFMQKGMSANQMFNQHPTKEFDAQWGDPELFIYNAYPGLWNHVRELGKIV